MKKIKNKKIKWLDDWNESLIWCPSQLTRKFKLDNHVYVLYCRWRWNDPWTFSFYKNDDTLSGWTDIGVGLTEYTPISEIKSHAEALLTTYLIENKRI